MRGDVLPCSLVVGFDGSFEDRHEVRVRGRGDCETGLGHGVVVRCWLRLGRESGESERQERGRTRPQPQVPVIWIMSDRRATLALPDTVTTKTNIEQTNQIEVSVI